MDLMTNKKEGWTIKKITQIRVIFLGIFIKFLVGKVQSSKHKVEEDKDRYTVKKHSENINFFPLKDFLPFAREDGHVAGEDRHQKTDDRAKREHKTKNSCNGSGMKRCVLEEANLIAGASRS